MHRNKQDSITSSAVLSRVGGMVSTLAVLRLRTNSNCVGCITGTDDDVRTQSHDVVYVRPETISIAGE